MRAVLVLTLVLAACGGKAQQPTTPQAQILSPAEIAKRAKGSIVLIQTPKGLGTGFVVWQDGRIVTNLHVIAGVHSAKVKFHDGKTYDDVQVLAADAQHDLAILRVNAKNLVPLILGDSNAVNPGERVIAIGNPHGLELTVSDGLVSGVRHLEPEVTLLQISAPISPGSSGGPLFNERGEVIGVAARYSEEGNLNFGVPVEYLKPMLLAENAVSLDAFARQLDMMLLQACTPDELKMVITELDNAIKVGAPLFNKGDHEGCFKLYEKTALDVSGKMKSCPGVKQTLLTGIQMATQSAGFNEKAWALRHAFDKVFSAVRAAVESTQAP
jgi:serine protease Do